MSGLPIENSFIRTHQAQYIHDNSSKTQIGTSRYSPVDLSIFKSDTLDEANNNSPPVEKENFIRTAIKTNQVSRTCLTAASCLLVASMLNPPLIFAAIALCILGASLAVEEEDPDNTHAQVIDLTKICIKIIKERNLLLNDVNKSGNDSKKHKKLDDKFSFIIGSSSGLIKRYKDLLERFQNKGLSIEQKSTILAHFSVYKEHYKKRTTFPEYLADTVRHLDDENEFNDKLIEEVLKNEENQKSP